MPAFLHAAKSSVSSFKMKTVPPTTTCLKDQILSSLLLREASLSLGLELLETEGTHSANADVAVAPGSGIIDVAIEAATMTETSGC
mmetsp:Transcript_2524/g.5396  ORF Transcript_2524/g.5396 Transcript_2524/m.5396 type:complete len:86 (+) Transcript_2524:332-589(+)